MLEKIRYFFRNYGLIYTIKKIIHKIYVRQFLGRFSVRRRISQEQRNTEEQTEFEQSYVFSILVPLYNTPENFLREMIQSVQMQTYAGWQLCLADGSDASHGYVEQLCSEYTKNDSRIVYEKLEKNLGISENTNACIRIAKGDYICLFDHDDLLHPSALFEVMQTIETLRMTKGKKADFIYTDEATFEGKETHLLSVHYKPDFCMENLRANNYICHFTTFSKELLEQTGGFNSEYDGSQDHDMILRLCEKASNICHISKVLYWWRAHKDSVALQIDSKSYAVDAGIRAVKAHLERCGLEGSVSISPKTPLVYDVIYDTQGINVSDVQVIRVKDKDILIEDVIQESNGKAAGVILLLWGNVLPPDEANMSRMLMHMVKPEVGAVTGKIIGSDGKYNKLPKDDPGYMNRLTYATGTDVICNGCMLVRKSLVITALDNNMKLKTKEDCIEFSNWIRRQGYELLDESRAEVFLATKCLQWYNNIGVF